MSFNRSVTRNSNSASRLMTMLHLRRLLTIVLLLLLSPVSINGQAEGAAARGVYTTRGWASRMKEKVVWRQATTLVGRGLVTMRLRLRLGLGLGLRLGLGLGERDGETVVSEVVHDKENVMINMGERRRSCTSRPMPWRRVRLQEEVGTYCVAIESADQTALQAALDWACSPDNGNVDCGPLQAGGSCYEPNDLVHHASYAFNSYYLAQNGVTGSCSFNGVATPTTTNPSNGTCVYVALGSSSTTATTPSSEPTSTNTTSSTATESPSSSSIVLASSITYTLCALVTSLILTIELANFPFKTLLTSI